MRTKEEREVILEQAKKRYPLGTIYKSADGRCKEDILEVTRELRYVTDNAIFIDGGRGYLVSEGGLGIITWAEIVSLPKEKDNIINTYEVW